MFTVLVILGMGVLLFFMAVVAVASSSKLLNDMDDLISNTKPGDEKKTIAKLYEIASKISSADKDAVRKAEAKIKAFEARI